MFILNPRGSGASFALITGLIVAEHSKAQAIPPAAPTMPEEAATSATPTTSTAPVQAVEIRQTVKKEIHDDYSNSRSYDRRYLDQFGDTNTAELLSRLPGISADDKGAKGMSIRLRGAGNGYTQILVDGQPLPQGFTIDQIPASQIERIEVLRTPGVELSQQAPGGAINLIMKPKMRTANAEFHWTQSLNQSRWNHQLSGQWSDQAGALAYMLGVQLDSQTQDKLDQSVQQTVNAAQLHAAAVTEIQQTHRQSLNLQQRLQYRTEQGAQLSWQSWMQFQRPVFAKQDRESGDIPAADFALSANEFTARNRSWRQEWSWDGAETEYGKLSAKVNWNWLDRHTAFWFNGSDASAALQEKRWVSGSVRESNWRLALQWAWGQGDMQWKSGWEWKPGYRTETRDETVQEMNGPSPSPDFRRFQTDSRNRAWYLQQEWQVRPGWNWSLGVRAEWSASTVAASDSIAVHQQTLAWSPVWQQVWKTANAYQWRLAASQTWKMPDMFQLTPRPYRIDNNNSPDNPDQQGNPALLPERSRGLELSLESAGNDEGGWSAGLFWRRLHQRIADDLRFDNGRWLVTPVNAGDADWYGAEAELHGQTSWLQRWLPAGRLNWKASGFYNYSKVASLSGPDNHIPEQLPWGLNLQADLALNAKTKIGVTVSRNGAERYQSNSWLWLTQTHHWQVDSYLHWQLSTKDSLRLSVSDWLARGERSTSWLSDGTQSWYSQRNTGSARTVRLNWETRW